MSTYLVLNRTKQLDTHTEGQLLVYKENKLQFSCFSLELPWRDNARNVSCVPAGEYDLEKEYSPRFKKYLVELKQVQDRSEIKIHRANYVTQLAGCIAPGLLFTDLNQDGLPDIAYSGVCEDIINNLVPSKSKLIIWNP